MASPLYQSIELLSREKGIEPEIVVGAVEDAIAATHWVCTHAASLGIDASKLVVGGDSAGADDFFPAMSA